MSLLWWFGGVGSTEAAAGTPADNAPSLWSGGWRWGDPAAPFGDGTDFYWGAVAAATARTGRPRLSVAIAGGLVLNELRSASWSLGRQDWLSTLAATNASFEFVDEPIAAINDSIVIGLMSDATEYHSDSLWVGRVTDVTSRRDLDGNVSTTISATDVVGILGRDDAPTSIVAGYTLKTLTERLAADAGLSLEVDTDPLVTLPILTAASDISGKVIDLINRAERSSNALLFLRGNGRLYAAMRDTTGASSAKVVALDGDDSASSWTEQTGLRGVVTRWKLGDGVWSTDTASPNLEVYGDQTFSAEDLLITDPVPYANLIASDVLGTPRAILVEAPFPIRDLGQKVLALNPLDRVVADGVTWQVMSVEHRVSPIEIEEGKRSAYGDWQVTIAADATQEALAGAPEPGPVTPPALNTVTLQLTSTKSAWVTPNDGASGSDGVLYVGRFLDGVLYRSYIEFPIAWPANTLRVVSATLNLTTESRTSDSRINIQPVTESWTEGGLSWGGPSTTAAGRRAVNVDGSTLSVSVTAIAEAWRATGENNGLHLRSVNEADTDRRVSFFSDDAGVAADRPQLTLTVEVIS